MKHYCHHCGKQVENGNKFCPHCGTLQDRYSDDYRYDIYKRYSGGEMYDADSIKVDTTAAYKTIGGRTVYGGGDRKSVV